MSACLREKESAREILGPRRGITRRPPRRRRTRAAALLSTRRTTSTRSLFSLTASSSSTSCTSDIGHKNRPKLILNAKNQLVQVAHPDGQFSLFAYMPDSPLRRLHVTKDGTARAMLWDPVTQNLIEDLTPGGVSQATHTHEMGMDQLLVSQDAEGRRAFLRDTLNSVRGLADEIGTKVNYYSYEAFGSPRSEIEASPNRFRFTGREWDPETREQYTRWRNLLPALGRWSQPDPLYAESWMNERSFPVAELKLARLQFAGRSIADAASGLGPSLTSYLLNKRPDGGFPLSAIDTNHYGYAWMNPATASDPLGLITVRHGACGVLFAACEGASILFLSGCLAACAGTGPAVFAIGPFCALQCWAATTVASGICGGILVRCLEDADYCSQGFPKELEYGPKVRERW